MIRASQAYSFIVALLFTSVLLVVPSTLFAQETDPVIEDNNEEKIENISNNTDGDIDYSDLLEELAYYQKHKINLNTAKAEDLQRLNLLTDIQISNLLTHIAKNGKLLSLYELQSIDGFDLATIKNILPYVKVSNEVAGKFNFKDAMNYGNHDLFIRYQRVLEQQQGYSPISDSALAESPNSRYLGSPDKIYLRYRYKYFNKISLGITAEKDAGEQFFTGAQKYGFDFYSAHLVIKDVGIFKTIALGDFHAQFGQGLSLWTGLGFGKSSDVVNIKKYALGIKPYTSANESDFMRGGAITIAKKGFEFTGLYSNKSVDANINGVDSVSGEILLITSIQESGLHTTASELADRRSIREQVMGGHLAFINRHINIGLTAVHSRFNTDLQRNLQLYNQFDFNGKTNTNFGLDYSYIFRNINLFGEFSYSINGGYATLDGIMMSLDPHVSVSVLYRNYRKNYQALFTSAFGEGSNNVNEEGIFTGLTLKFTPKWNLSAYCDFFNFNWLRYQVDAPSKGQDYMTQLTYRPNKKLEMYLKYRFENKAKNNTSDENLIDYPVDLSKQSIRYNLSYQVSPTFVIKSRVEFMGYRKEKENPEKGYLIYQDIRYKPEKLPFSISLRYSLFQTDSYDSRIYVYENDVLYAYSIPSFYYKGSRFYAMLKFDIGRHFDLWLRYAITSYSNKNVIGSGLTEIQGNQKSEIKAQIRMKF